MRKDDMLGARLTSGSLVLIASGASCLQAESLAFEGESYEPCVHIPFLHVQCICC